MFSSGLCLSELSPQAPGASDGNRLLHQQRQHHHTHSDWLWLWNRLHGASDCGLTRLYTLKLCRPSSSSLRSWLMCSNLRKMDIYILKVVSPLIRKASPALKPSWWSHMCGNNCSRVDEPLTSDVCWTFFCVNTTSIQPNVCFMLVCLTQFYSK